MVNTIYALLIERAQEQDRIELAWAPHADEKKRDTLGRHREDLDDILTAPIGEQAVADDALIRYLTGG